MILNKETRNQVKIGSVLTDNRYSFKVTNLWEVYHGKGILITVRVVKSADTFHMPVGGVIYGTKLSGFYGMIIE